MKNTSKEAFESIKPTRPNLHRIILRALYQIKQGSFRDIASAAGLKPVQVWKRLSELERKNRIKPSGTKICPTSLRRVTIWKLIE